MNLSMCGNTRPDRSSTPLTQPLSGLVSSLVLLLRRYAVMVEVVRLEEDEHELPLIQVVADVHQTVKHSMDPLILERQILVDAVAGYPVNFLNMLLTASRHY